MATSLKELIVTYQANAKPALDALHQIDAKIRQTSKNIKDVGDSFTNIGKQLTFSLSAPLLLLGGGAIKASADFETLRMQMEVLTGSAEEGDRIFRRMLDFARTTPFELKGLTKAANTLMGFGESADDALDHIKLIGDVAAISGGDFNGIIRAFGQASALGRVMGRDIIQFTDNGVPMITMLSKSLGVSKDKISDMVTAGKITFPVLLRAFQDATSKGGMFEDGMVKLSRTSKGVYSNFKDSLNIALAEFGDEIQKALGLTDKLESFGNWIGRLADNFKRLYPETKKTIIVILALATVIGPLLIFIGAFIKLVGLATLAFSLLIAPIKLLITLLPALLTIIRGVMLVFAANPFTAFIAATIAIVYYWREIVDLFKMAADWVSKISISGMWDKVKDFSGEITSKITGGANKAISGNTNNSSIANNQKTVNNNLTVNIPPGTSAADSTSIKNSIFAALAEQNRQSYIEVGAQ